jgi:hypothetical protein
MPSEWTTDVMISPQTTRLLCLSSLHGIPGLRGIAIQRYANLDESAARAVCIGTSTANPAATTLPKTTAHNTAYRAEPDWV